MDRFQVNQYNTEMPANLKTISIKAPELLPRIFPFKVTCHKIDLFCSQDFFQFASGPGVDATLRKRAEKFKAHLTKKFRWDFETDLDDCAPVVVELPEGVTVD